MAAPSTLRLMPEYGAGWPLWEAGGRTHPTSFVLTDELRADLLEWQDFFEEHFHYERGWDDARSRRWFDDQGHRLAHRLRAELPDTDIELVLWTSST
jgi:hypothetical protein